MTQQTQTDNKPSAAQHSNGADKVPNPKKPDFPKTLTLSEPVKFGDEELSTLTIRWPKGRDFRAVKSATPIGMALDLAAELCDVPPSVIDDLAADDTKAVMGIVGPFLA